MKIAPEKFIALIHLYIITWEKNALVKNILVIIYGIIISIGWVSWLG